MADYTIYANKSAWIDEANPAVNHSTEADLSIRNVSDVERIAFLKDFDLSAIPADQIISKVEFFYYLISKDAALDTTRIMLFEALNRSWDEGAVAYNDYPNYTLWVHTPVTELPTAGTYGSLNIPLNMLQYIRAYGLGVAFSGSANGGIAITSSRAATNKPYLKITADYPKPAVVPESPKSVFVSGDKERVFSWSYTSDNGDAQKSYSLQYSTDGLTWASLASGTSAETSCAVPAGTLPAGKVYWRVQATSEYDVVSDWSDAIQIVVQAAPAAPSIQTVTITPKPTITWQSIGQQAFQAKTDGYDSGTVYGTAKTFKIPIFLSDGAHEIQLRVQNSFGLWSDWSSVTANVANVAQAAITVAAQAVQNGVTLTWVGTHTSFIIYRGGVQIASQTATTFTDYLTNAEHKYQIRGVVGDNYALSNEVSGTPTISSAAIAVIGDYDWLQLVSLRGQRPSLSISETHDVTYQHYSGRKLPVAEKSGFVSRTGNFTFSFRTKAEAEKLRGMGGETVVYKDSREILIGVLNETPSSIDSISWDVSGTIVEVDYEDS